MRPFFPLAGLAAFLTIAASCAVAGETGASAPSSGILMVQGSPSAVHWHESPDYKGTPWLIGAEWQMPSHWVAGYSYFNNSFDQRSQYIYGGYWWRLSGNDPMWYAKVTGGAILGYQAPYDNKIPLNHNGVAPAIVPGLGYKVNRFNAQFNLLGSAGFMITVGYDLVR